MKNSQHHMNLLLLEAAQQELDEVPADFMLQLSPTEFANLMSQFAASSWGGKQKLPNAFTEHRSIMADLRIKQLHQRCSCLSELLRFL